VGLFTGHKIGDLSDKPDACAGLLRQAAIPFEPVSAHQEREFCGWSYAVRMRSTEQRPRPTDTLTCPMAAGVDLWMDRVVQPAAIENFGTRVNRVESMGSYSCRRIYGRPAGVWSQHAEANAVDVGAFRLSDGRRVIVARDWQSGARGKFLHEVRDGACRLFATTLSPDYNAAHHDHLHLDLARRGSVGWAMCR
jgi:hypothetical protein